MRTVRSRSHVHPSMHWAGGCLPRGGGGCLLGVCLPMGCLPGGGVYPSMHWGRHPPSVDRILDTHLWKYYLAATSLRTVINYSGFGRGAKTKWPKKHLYFLWIKFWRITSNAHVLHMRIYLGPTRSSGIQCSAPSISNSNVSILLQQRQWSLVKRHFWIVICVFFNVISYDCPKSSSNILPILSAKNSLGYLLPWKVLVVTLK